MTEITTERTLFARDALLPTGWARDVLLEWDAGGHFVRVSTGALPGSDVRRAAGPVIAGMPNLHSHAFQRVFSGLAESRATNQDSFWSWRELMYRVALDLTPEQLESIATWVYIEMLEAGYTSVCEFHYVHHDTDGRPYADDAALAQCVVRAAERAGIGLTLLPVLYQSGGFGGAPPSEQQQRFVRSTESFLRLIDGLAPSCATSGVRLGIAAHSLRAVQPESLRDALDGFERIDPTGPIHIHIAEQKREVDDCLAWSGQRPVEWLLDHAGVNERWCLVHATHMTADETGRAARTGAVAGLCPTTEANLGDGIFNLPVWSGDAGGARGHWGVGSDSQVCVNAAEELLVLEYSQRLQLQRRNIAASTGLPQVATAMMLAAVDGGARAAGHLRAGASDAGLSVGGRADFVVLDAEHVLLRGLSPAQMLSVHVFGSHRTSAVHDLWVMGRRTVSAGSHDLRATAAAEFARARSELLGAVR
ncbi:MAG TPA: formimidoylglutamate deiminase [Gemmatimonadaceae bacterium]|jgi:formimidoylglutamate deiminase